MMKIIHVHVYTCTCMYSEWRILVNQSDPHISEATEAVAKKSQEKILNGILPYDLCDTGLMLYYNVTEQ